MHPRALPSAWDRRNYQAFAILQEALLITLILISSCSVVFRGGVGGIITDKTSSSGIEDVRVWAYLDESARDTDYTNHGSNPLEIENSSMVKGSARTDTNGEFTISAIIWDSSNPLFGKTADYKKVFFLFYHELYGLKKNQSSIRIYSDATNSGSVNESFDTIKERSTISFRIEDVANNNPLGESVEAKITIYSALDEVIEERTEEINGTGSIEVTKDKEATIKVSVSLKKELSNWSQCDEQGAPVTTPLPTTTITSTNPSPIRLFMKSSKLTLPSISGSIRLSGTGTPTANHLGTSADDNQALLLCEIDVNDKLILLTQPSARRVTAQRGTGANNETVFHGEFNGLGANIEFVDITYTGTYATKRVAIVVDADNDGAPEVEEKFFEVAVRSNEQGSWNVGVISNPDTIE
ncbi:MAG: hypothetical protein EOM67_15595, partial [Spirochaetia bacterium]|nr:hypothetical protein [Spirochaetia bacterium]